VALTLSWPALNVSGQTKRATACALQITIGNLGAVIGTQLYRAEDSPRYVVGHGVALAYMTGNIIVTSVLWAYLRSINRKRDAVEEGEGGTRLWDGEWKGDQDLRWRFTT
jgi:hypothetical protein